MAPVEGSAITNRTYYDSATKSLREKAPSPIWPTDSRRVTWEYGPTHKLGMDIGGIVAGVAGDEVRASQGGEVTTSGSPEWSPSGSSYVIVAGDDGLEYRYVHMADLEVQQGDRVEQGEPLGKMDAVGAPGGVHLHFEIREDGKAQNPRNYLPE
ncbi:MAG TPA: M23 family metallopeptidase [bacterium]|nr:M23 family metallopeptidase [bacterium]